MPYLYELYQVREHDLIKIYSNYDKNFVIHEMLSTILSRLYFLKLNINNGSISVNNTSVIFNDLIIKKIKLPMETIHIQKKLYPYIVSTYVFDSLETKKMSTINCNIYQQIDIFIKSLKNGKLGDKKKAPEIGKHKKTETISNILSTKYSPIVIPELTRKPHIPIQNEENEENDGNECKEVCDLEYDGLDLENLKIKIDELQEIKKQSEQQINLIKEQHEKETANYVDYICELNYMKNKELLDKERYEEKKKVFQSDIQSYLLIKNDIENGKISIDKIPPLFNNKYHIFCFMDQNNLFNNEESYSIYGELYEKYIADDDNDDENSNCDNSECVKVDLLEDFFTKRKINTIKSSESILEELTELDKLDKVDKLDKCSDELFI